MMHAKRWLLALSAVLALVGVGVTGAADIDLGGPRWAPATHGLADDPPAATGHTTEGSVIFHVPTITCPTCPLRVEASIRKAPGILGVTFNGQDVTVIYDPSAVSPEAIAAAIEAAGDIAEPVGA
jgi:copper chaperone CopZ